MFFIEKTLATIGTRRIFYSSTCTQKMPKSLVGYVLGALSDVKHFLGQFFILFYLFIFFVTYSKHLLTIR